MNTKEPPDSVCMTMLNVPSMLSRMDDLAETLELVWSLYVDLTTQNSGELPEGNRPALNEATTQALYKHVHETTLAHLIFREDLKQYRARETARGFEHDSPAAALAALLRGGPGAT